MSSNPFAEGDIEYDHRLGERAPSVSPSPSSTALSYHASTFSSGWLHVAVLAHCVQFAVLLDGQRGALSAGVFALLVCGAPISPKRS